MDKFINWQPEEKLQAKIIKLAEALGSQPEVIINEAVNQYIEKNRDKADIEKDPLIGLFSGKKELATESEKILQQEIKPESGWTWKK